ncbi:MAG: pyridoxamine 5'-phosphate oxidase family protein [Pseudomonadota bacterium]
MYQPTDVISSEAEVYEILGSMNPNQEFKVIDHIDVHCRAWIERSPFVVVSTIDASGKMDVSPKGDPPGFVKILDEKTLAIPDRLGNRRADTFRNILQTSRIGLMFVVPKRGEVVRVGGSAQIVVDPPLLESMTVNGRPPQLATLVRVETAFYHCGKAMIRSRMWKPDEWGDIGGLPSYAQALIDHANPPETLEEMQDLLDKNERDRLY